MSSPGANVEPELLARVIRLVIGAADMAVIGKSFPCAADQTQAAVSAAIECALANGLVRVVPAEEWPEYVVTRPKRGGPADD